MTTSPNQENESTDRHAKTAQDAAVEADEAAVRELYQRLMDGWNRGSGDAFASVFAEDGDLVGFDGTRLRGRAEIASFHQALFDKWLTGTRLIGTVESVTFPAPDVAVVHAVGGTILPGKSTPAPERDSIQTLVATNREGEWLFTAFQNTRVRPVDRSLGSVVAWKLSDVLWKLSRLRTDSTSRFSTATSE
ncbi:SgcJ/EcaC family oxidoreductase [Natronococcus wangiae]|uniref:SgcJ/EcaC family oxidoreductase n=1 Tax=Natronococcus wangiae TaxID=3068275 RepID=UPI00273E1E37|nr:SgcJ/EcaC family oxidoreductase [Natronococcus sp. AD5]